MQIDELERIASRAMDLGYKYNPDNFEIFIADYQITTININNGILSSTEQTDDLGLSCRMNFGKKRAMSFTSDLSEESIKNMIKNAVSTAKKSSEVEDSFCFPEKSGTPFREKLYYSELLNTSIEELVEITKELLENCEVKGINDPIIPILGGSFLGVQKSILLNSYGIKAINRSTFYFCYIGALGIKEGKPGPMHVDLFISRKRLIPNPSNFANQIAKESYNLAVAKKIQLSEKELPVVLHPWALDSIGTSIFLPAIRADNKQIGNSFLADRLGEKLFPTELEIYDDGTMPEGINSSYYDDEGIARQKTPIFSEGIFKSFIYDHTTALKDETQSTGNATRTDSTGVNPSVYANPPSVGISNWTIKAGKEDFDSLISDIKLGILINQIHGAHQGSPESGEFTGVINPGYLIRNGELAEPIVGIGLSGNIMELFRGFEGATAEKLPVNAGSLPYTRFKKVRLVS